MTEELVLILAYVGVTTYCLIAKPPWITRTRDKISAPIRSVFRKIGIR